jgi:hypothetical protein
VNAHPFNHHHWPPFITHPEDFPGGDSLGLQWDFGLPPGQDKRKLIAAWSQRLPQLQQLKRLSIWSQVTRPPFEAACTLGGLEALELKWSNLQSLEPIRHLRQLRALRIGSSTRIESIEPLADLAELRFLHIENFAKITDFSPLCRLTRLESLVVDGSMWSRQAIASLEPFACMTWLKSLAVDTSTVTSLRPLARLQTLEQLDVGGKLPFEEYAWLSAKLPNTCCRRFAPFIELTGSGIDKCKKCAQPAMVMPTGRNKPFLCKHCDEAKLRKHVEAFETARRSALAEG